MAGKSVEENLEDTAEESIDSSDDDSVDGMENYGVFQDDYEFKFVQEGTDRTTLMLPPVTYDSMAVRVFNVEMEVDSELEVGEVEKEVTKNGTTRYVLKIIKHDLVPPQADEDVEKKFGEEGYEIEYEDIVDVAAEKAKKRKGKKSRTAMDAHNYSKPKVVVTSAPEVKVEIIEDATKESADDTSNMTVALDGTMIEKKEDSSTGEGDDDYFDFDDEDGDGDDDFEELEVTENSAVIDDEAGFASEDIPITRKQAKKKKKKAETNEGGTQPRRKYDKTSHYSKEADHFTLERNEAGGRLYKCALCPYTSNQLANITSHVRRHIGKKPNLCALCGKGFVCTTGLKNHMRSHSEERPLACEICNKTFKTWQSLKFHRARHFEGKFKCSFCHKGFYSIHTWKDHEAIHRNEYNYSCSYCKKPFRLLSSMKRHELLHTGGRLKCHLCEETFIRRDYWRKHMIKYHFYDESDELLATRVQRVQKVFANPMTLECDASGIVKFEPEYEETVDPLTSS